MAEITVYYHPGFSGRAQPIAMMAAAAGRPYKYAAPAEVTSAEKETLFAPPFAKCGDKILSQTTAICAWLGDELGLAPPKDKTAEVRKDRSTARLL